ncbi:hypothetical protein [Streptomyces sp. MBT53]|uniref:hypothetical protein n=1 Tax=Streptomyces sp. MBT53 TaxID=1488384 RepID=UPI00191451DC|nr:hypothetical protein [Streptomyces sp. MBT53]MBK6013556.1 hypothetical protein [Streptomyces sp. MBT53]
MEQRASTVVLDLAGEDTWWIRKEKFPADSLAAGNALRFTRLYLHADFEHVFVDIEDASAVAGVLMANAVRHARVPEYAQITVEWALLASGDVVIQVRDRRRDFPDFDEVMKWEPAEGDRPRGLWIARRRGAEIAYAPVDDGKVVQALITPRALAD